MSRVSLHGCGIGEERVGGGGEEKTSGVLAWHPLALASLDQGAEGMQNK